jgi:gliding motility-associated protein GldM
MIGMMYLVLTAMLALNVSSDVLNAFTKVQAGLTQTVSNYYKMNQQIYADFDNAYTLNEGKVKPWRDKAFQVKTHSDKLYDYLEDLKWEIVRKADGEEADINNIKAKDDSENAAEVMIVNGKAADLKSMLVGFKKYVLDIVCEQNPVLCKTLEVNLSTANPPNIDGEIQTWASSNFEHMPLSAVITLMTKLQADVRNAESDVISHLYKNIDAGSFKFNSISAHVVPESRYILQGENYKAKILLAAIDTTQRPVVEINGEKITNCNGDATVYKTKCSKVGVYKWKGLVKYVTPTGETKEYKISDEYIVAAPSVVVSPLKMNVFFTGVDNPVMISVPGIASENIVATATNATIKKVKDIYIVRPKKPGVACKIAVGMMEGRTVRNMQTLNFRVKTVPNPIATISNKKGGEISQSLLSASWGVKADLEEFDFDMKFVVLGFNLYTIGEGGYVKEAASNSANFSRDQKAIISKVRRGQRVVIDNIRAKGPDGNIRKLQSVSFKII